MWKAVTGIAYTHTKELVHLTHFYEIFANSAVKYSTIYLLLLRDGIKHLNFADSDLINVKAPLWFYKNFWKKVFFFEDH